AESPVVRGRHPRFGGRGRKAEDLGAFADREDGFCLSAPLRSMNGYYMILLDKLARQLDGESVIPFAIFRNRHQLAPTNAPLGVNFLHCYVSSGAALHAVAGALLGERHHKADDYLIAKRVG